MQNTDLSEDVSQGVVSQNYYPFYTRWFQFIWLTSECCLRTSTGSVTIRSEPFRISLVGGH
ncbi:hypothetical protein BTUL_0090g00260 [Botrytis tulipae]|uniref:Uncharacterized protein n=1 Tax=Botrytis tulipae TaxID=87230 RepID=A0A4Z1EIX1_9HELO|nr:hypothetical protein BTUL_0090g00260 [Botrytis tulipae]